MKLDDVKAEAKRTVYPLKHRLEVKGKAVKLSVENLTPQAVRLIRNRFGALSGWEVTWSERNGTLTASKRAR